MTDFSDGHFEVGPSTGQIEPGTYVTEREVNNCYWERVNANGATIDNDFVSGAPKVRVTIRSSDAGFNSEGCGHWVKE